MHAQCQLAETENEEVWCYAIVVRFTADDKVTSVLFHEDSRAIGYMQATCN